MLLLNQEALAATMVLTAGTEGPAHSPDGHRVQHCPNGGFEVDYTLAVLGSRLGLHILPPNGPGHVLHCSRTTLGWGDGS